MLTHGSLFAGIGGFDLGFQWARIKTVWQVEIDDYCRQVLAQRFPEAERFSDIKDCGAHNLKEVDIISGGFPCQDISVAGKQVGVTGSRSGLWSEMHRVISELRPRYAIIENVPNLARLGLDRVLANLAAIGYDAEWQCISARYVGVWQKRRRLFIVAYPTQNGSQEIFYQNTLNAPGHRKRMDAFGGDLPDLDYQNNRTSALSLLGNGEWAKIPNRERSGNDGGIPNRVDRLKGLGNAIVPQIAEIIGRLL